jgi:hypothetical protein
MANVMDGKVNAQVNCLGYHLWLSAGREYKRVIDFWIMAEQMVWELTVASARLSGSAIEAGAAVERTAPAIAAIYLQRIRELAYFMWEASGAQCDRAMDYWIAAERHVTTMMVTSGEIANCPNTEPGAGPGEEAGSEPGSELGGEPRDKQRAGQGVAPDHFSAEAYLNEIRTGAYYIWENAGEERSGDPLRFWLAAERQVLHRIEADARMKFCAAATGSPHLREPEADAFHSGSVPHADEVALARRRAGVASRSLTHPSPLRIRRLAPAPGARTH